MIDRISKEGHITNQDKQLKWRLAFYDEDYNLTLRTGYTTGNTYTLSSTQWSTITAASTTIYCCVETSQTSTPSTGAYYSNLIEIENP